MEIDILQVTGLEHAVNAMRLPMKSGHKSDSGNYIGKYLIGSKDFDLSMNLVNAGSSHRKHLRLIDVWMKIKAPRFFWSEFDTYRFGVDKVSESTMHRIMKDEIKESDFEPGTAFRTIELFREQVERARKSYEPNEALRVVKCNLPEGYLQTRIVKCSYEALRKMYEERKNHRLKEWKLFCLSLERLPNAEFIIDGKEND